MSAQLQHLQWNTSQKQYPTCDCVLSLREPVSCQIKIEQINHLLKRTKVNKRDNRVRHGVQSSTMQCGEIKNYGKGYHISGDQQTSANSHIPTDGQVHSFMYCLGYHLSTWTAEYLWLTPYGSQSLEYLLFEYLQKKCADTAVSSCLLNKDTRLRLR